MIQHLNITVSGRVQGVNYRSTTKNVADQLSIKGFAMNLEDGSVYIEAEGEKWLLEEFLEWCAEGPEAAKVEKVEHTEGELKKYTDFTIRRNKA